MATPQSILMPLQELNREFRQAYIKARDNFWRLATEDGSVIIGNGSSLTLIHKGTIDHIPKAIPQVYHDLKSIAHIPLTIYILLANKSLISNDDTLSKYWKLLEALQVPTSIGLNEKPTVERIISASQAFLLQEMSSNGSIDSEMLSNFCQSLSDDLTTLMDAAAIAQLNEMHIVIQDWLNRKNIDALCASLKVLLIGARTARQNNLQSTYFECLLGAERAREIAYIEELYDNETKAKSIFSTWFFDEQISTSFFNDSDRMHRDLLMSERVQQEINKLLLLASTDVTL